MSSFQNFRKTNPVAFSIYFVSLFFFFSIFIVYFVVGSWVENHSKIEKDKIRQNLSEILLNEVQITKIMYKEYDDSFYKFLDESTPVNFDENYKIVQNNLKFLCDRGDSFKYRLYAYKNYLTLSNLDKLESNAFGEKWCEKEEDFLKSLFDGKSNIIEIPEKHHINQYSLDYSEFMSKEFKR